MAAHGLQAPGRPASSCRCEAASPLQRPRGLRSTGWGGYRGSQTVAEAGRVLEARAPWGETANVGLRWAALPGGIWLDLGSVPGRQFVEVRAGGWELRDRPPEQLWFKRPSGFRPQVVPTRGGGDLLELRRFLNVADDEDLARLLVFVFAAAKGSGPFALLAMSGPPGSTRSSASRVVRALLDPNGAPLRALPRDERELAITASNSFLLALDNVSDVPPALADALCRLTQGAGFSTRELYSDDSESIFTDARPVIVNGIPEVVASRSDLLDRALVVALSPLPPSKRRTEEAIRSDLEAALPRLLGALLDALAEGLARLPTLRPLNLPRLADASAFAVACESAVALPPGWVARAIAGSREDAAASILEGDPVAAAVVALVGAEGGFVGTSAQLLNVLGERVGERASRSRSWPGSARALAGTLRRLAPLLVDAGVGVSFEKRGRDRERQRVVELRRVEPGPTFSAGDDEEQPLPLAAAGDLEL